MALFNREPEKSSKPQAASMPQVHPVEKSAVSAPAMVESRPAPAASKPSSAAEVESHAYLDSGSKINGKLYFATAAQIDGQIEGEITAKDSVTLGQTAVITAQISAASVIVAGRVNGDITATQRIEIRPSAKVVGNVTAPILIVHEGALFEGHCAMQPEAAHDERKVTVFPKEERLAQAAGQKPA